MDQIIEVFGYALLVGTVATGVMDLGGWALKHAAGLPMPRYDLVGRWVAWMVRGRLVHRPIAASPAMRGEKPLGWFVHYTIGVVFAFALLWIQGVEWIAAPTVMPALIVGIGSVAAPFLLMQPCMGAGIASHRAPDPATARVRSLINHALFAGGLYIAGWTVRCLAVSP
ncbi:DUF2938 family protein [Panacagrimonas perspica]|uniref:DUF2938 family protein n=1 Tax=Panacagrimonas perspica TaxID=381431 RepID=A0A4S3JZ63_9GAMM|nr:DUF2938 domain-containing protein [Panacagrimonas perspica]TDU28499.1 DUF2938 family protein [Panacagrimonas perspica]THD00897.1 hypothetical protein B1810_22625 [Panacagrimonas perspica]